MTILITAAPVYVVDAPPANLLTVTVTNTAPNAVAPNTAVTLWRIHADGSEHRVATSTQVRVIPTTAVVQDYHCPYNVEVTYRVTIGSASATTLGWLPSEVSWLVPASDVAMAVPVYPEEVVSFGDRHPPSRAVKMTPVGGKSIFKSDGFRDGMKTSIVLRVLESRVPEFMALFADDGVILLNTSADESWDLTWMWAQPDPTYSNPVVAALYKKRLITISLDESADPDLDLTPPWTCAGLTAWAAANGVTNATLPSFYATNTDLAINRLS